MASSDKDGSNDPKAQFLLATLYETVWSDQKNSFIKSFNFYQLSLNNKENNTFSKRTFQAILAIYKNLDKETLNNQSMGLKEIAAKFYAVLKSEKRSCFIKEFNQDVLEVLKNLEELKTQVNLKESLGFPINNDYERGWFEELVGNKETAKEFYQKSIDVNDDVPSLYNLANLLYNDKTDDTRCIKLLIRAFEKKDLRCLSILCSMYYEKRFVTNNPEMFLIPLSIDYSDKQKEELLFDPLDLR